MTRSVCTWLRALRNSRTPAAPWCLALAFVVVFANGLRAGIVPNSDSEHPDNGSNDPYVINANQSFVYVNIHDDDTLVMNSGTINNLSRPAGFWRSPLRMFDTSQAIINGGLIQDLDLQISTYTLDLNDQSHLVVNGGTFRQAGVGASQLLWASGSSSTIINGGDFHSVDNPVVRTRLSASVVINGGTFASGEDHVVQVQGGQVFINGGAFSGLQAGVRVLSGAISDSSVVLRGGRFQTDLDLLLAGGSTQLVARSASIAGVPLVAGAIPGTDGVIDLVWPDGVAESLKFQRTGGNFHLTLIPEPGTLSLASVAWLAALMQRRSRSCRRV